MRRTILTSALACALFALAGCSGHKAANNAAVTEETSAGEAIVTNDVTAIDAATGEAANMAPDVNYTFNEATLASNNASQTASGNATTPRPAAKKEPKPAPATAAPATPATNAATPATNTVSQ